MCGIIGAVTESNSIPAVLEGLKRLEYRGYDSFGFGFRQGNKLKVIKRVGKIGEFNEKIDSNSPICIGHSRWATHGRVTEANAHPHLSNNGKIAVVHNGIVENFQELKESLVYGGFKFNSETDTEVIANMIQFYMDKEKMDLVGATIETLGRIKGSYAVVIMHSDLDGLIGARKGSPLVVGVGNREYFIASDIPAFLPYTKRVIYLDEGEIAVIGKEFVKVFDLKKNREVKKEIDEIGWDMEQALKGSYEHFMLKEIVEQKETIGKAIHQNSELIEGITGMIKRAKGVFFVGCGTSYHACVSSSYIFSHVAKMHVNVVLASEFRNYEEFLTKETLVVAVSQSGETADLLDAVRTAKKKGSKVVAIVNVMGSTLMRTADKTIMMNSGPEICVLSTKSYTAQLAILLLLAYSVAGKLDEGKKIINETIEKIPELIDENLNKLKVVAKELKDKRDFFLIGRDLAYPSALEGALKIKEVSYIHAEAFAGGELKHGTIALIEENTPVIAFVTSPSRGLILSNVVEVKSRGAFIIGIDSKENDLYDLCIKVPSLGNADPIGMIIPIQILAYYLALERDCDPDKPRNLAKSVTVK